MVRLDPGLGVLGRGVDKLLRSASGLYQLLPAMHRLQLIHGVNLSGSILLLVVAIWGITILAKKLLLAL